MFALALWDAPRRRLFLARDRLGKKPLHYRVDRDGLAFASEPKAFLAEPGFTREVDLQAVSHYLQLRYVPAPLSAFKGVTKLPPAHTLIVEDGRVSVQRYWRLSYVPQIERSRTTRRSTGLTARLRAAVAPAPDQRRAARRVPERRHRLGPGRVVHGGAVAAGAHVLDRLRRAGVQRTAGRAARR